MIALKRFHDKKKNVKVMQVSITKHSEEGLPRWGLEHSEALPQSEHRFIKQSCKVKCVLRSSVNVTCDLVLIRKPRTSWSVDSPRGLQTWERVRRRGTRFRHPMSPPSVSDFNGTRVCVCACVCSRDTVTITVFIRAWGNYIYTFMSVWAMFVLFKYLSALMLEWHETKRAV